MIFDAVKYGHNCLYAVQISGIPVVWIERATGKTLPTGFDSEDGGLVIDTSGEVGIDHIDREKGSAVSMSLTFKLLDTDTTRDWMRRWSKSMTLTADMSESDTTATVLDTTGWASNDYAYLGLERIKIGAVPSGTSLTGITRARSGSLAYKHQAGTTAQVITDRPRYWAGRLVTLWAVPVDPSGYVPGAELLSDAVQVWKGKIAGQPTRAVDGFAFTAESLDRVVDQPLVASVTGEVKDTSGKYEINKAWKAQVVLFANDAAGANVWNHTIEIEPFSSLADGDLLTPAKMRELISTAWTAAISGITGDVGELLWIHITPSPKWDTNAWKAAIKIPGNALVYNINTFCYLDGQETVLDPQDEASLTYLAGMTPGPSYAYILVGWTSNGNPTIANDPGLPDNGTVQALTIDLHGGAVSDVPASGTVRLAANNTAWVLSYALKDTSGGLLYLSKLKVLTGPKVLPVADAQGATVEVLFVGTGLVPALMLQTLETSGTTLRGSYDEATWKQGQGYGLADTEVHEQSFLDAPDTIGSITAKINHAGATFGDLFGGTLGLFRRAVVARPDTSDTSWPIKLTLVDASPFGTGAAVTITDQDLLSHEGDPVTAVQKAETPTQITVTRAPGLWKDGEGDKMIVTDATQVEAVGRKEVEYVIHAADKESLFANAQQWVLTHLQADQTLQSCELTVPPWVDAQVGDLVKLDLTHPGLWTWTANPAGPGYTGPGRVVGRRMNLGSLRVTLTILFDGAVSIASLAPAALIDAYQHATAPTWIDVPLAYLPHFQAALADQPSGVWVYHYKPGKVETVGERHKVSAAASVGGKCRLTISANPTGHTLSTADKSTLTLPTTSGGHLSAFQGEFAHVDDGTLWG